MAMTLPQRKAPADTALDAFRSPEFEIADDRDRGPANAVIARLAQAISEQNAANQTDVTPREDRRWSRLQSLAVLALGSATLWVVVILAISALA